MGKPPRAQVRTAERPAQPAHVSTLAGRDAAGRASSSSPRPSYQEAVALYQHGLQLVQQHQFADAADALRTVLSLYPEERELHDRVRAYLSVCDRHLAHSSAPAPQTWEERLCAATLAMNAGDLDLAVAHLRAVLDEEPDHDGALYMLAVAHAQRRKYVEALGLLQRAVALNGENRALALHEPDLEEMLQDPSARALLQATVAASAETHRASTARPRAGR